MLARIVMVAAAAAAVRVEAIEHAQVSIDAFGAATKTGGTAGFFLDPGAVVGETPIRIGASAADDAAGGVLISSVAERGRPDATHVTGVQFATAGTVSDDDPLSLNTRNVSGGLSIVTTRAGAAGDLLDPPSPMPNAGQPFGASFGAGYFSFSEGWIGGTLSSSTVNPNGTFGALDTLTGSAGVTVDVDAFGVGYHRVNIPGVSDPFQQGMLVTSAASNVGRFTNVQPAPDRNGYIVSTVDNDGYFEFDPGSDPDIVNEGDGVATPFSFAFIPAGQTGLTAATINPSFTQSLGDVRGYSLFETGAGYNLTTVGTGEYRLTVNGGSPSQGTLLMNGVPLAFPGDNALTYQADGDGWLILTEDIEADFLTGNGTTLNELDGLGQGHDLATPYFSFAYLPNEGAATAAAAIPSADSFTRLNKSSITAWNAVVTAQNNDNNVGDVLLTVTEQTPGAGVVGLGNQKGDNSYAAYGQPLGTEDGIMFATISEGLRDNSSVGGFNEFGEVGTNVFSGYWAVITATADGSPQGEHNVNHAVAFFGRDSGFRMEAAVDIPNVSGVDLDQENTVVSFSGVNSLTDGVLIATPYGNDDNYLVAEPQADGAGWKVLEFDNSTTDGAGSEPDNFSYVYLPYESENLIAGLVKLDGSLASSTAGAGVEWTLTREEDGFSLPQYRLSIAGKTTADGMLLLTSTGRFAAEANLDNSMIYETDPTTGDFLIRGLDHIANGDTGFVNYEEAGFMFAYIDYAAPPIAPLPDELTGDYNGDGFVDAADYTVWRDSVGTSNVLPGDLVGGVIGNDQYQQWKDNFGASLAQGAAASQAAVPEPASLLGMSAALAAVGVLSRRRRPLVG
ncbi:PEP-CTERM sorting domain-containing protein [Pirellulimonas nuda]|nr:PEP-CTERM sorting domain-containing protein [Pirellulimonas nuda]